MPERLERALKPVLRGMFNPAARYPADPRIVFLLALCVFSGLTSLSLQAGPESLESLLPTWAVVSWGAVLTGGSLIAMIGVMRDDFDGILMEQVGSVAVGVSTIFYGVIAISIAGQGAIMPVGIIISWGLACLVRWVQLQLLINKAYRRKVETQLRDLFEGGDPE